MGCLRLNGSAALKEVVQDYDCVGCNVGRTQSVYILIQY